MTKTILKLPLQSKKNTSHIKFPEMREGSHEADIWLNMKPLQQMAEQDLLQPRKEAVQEILRKALS